MFNQYESFKTNEENQKLNIENKSEEMKKESIEEIKDENKIEEMREKD